MKKFSIAVVFNIIFAVEAYGKIFHSSYFLLKSLAVGLFFSFSRLYNIVSSLSSFKYGEAN